MKKNLISKNVSISAKNLSAVLFFIASFSSFAFSQCALTLEKIPPFHGLKLGMTVEQVSRYLNLKLPLKEKLSTADILKQELKIDIGEKIATLKNIPRPDFTGVSRLQLTFFENSLYDIELDYSKSGSRWKNLSEFEDQISKTLNLPRAAWQELPVLADLQCKDFVISANIIDEAPNEGGTSFWIASTATVKKILALAKWKLKAGR